MPRGEAGGSVHREGKEDGDCIWVPCLDILLWLWWGTGGNGCPDCFRCSPAGAGPEKAADLEMLGPGRSAEAELCGGGSGERAGTVGDGDPERVRHWAEVLGRLMLRDRVSITREAEQVRDDGADRVCLCRAVEDKQIRRRGVGLGASRPLLAVGAPLFSHLGDRNSWWATLKGSLMQELV